MENVMYKLPRNSYVFNCFLNIKDSCVQGRCFYPLINTLVMTLCAIIWVLIIGRGLTTLERNGIAG